MIRTIALAAVGTLSTGVAAVSSTTSAEAGPARVAHDSASVVPAAGSGTAYGYTALIRHETSPQDDSGRLMLLAPDGRSKGIGEVSDGARVMDVSSNARTVITGSSTDTGELRVTVWDTETRRSTLLRVKDGDEATIVKGGVVVTRYGKAAQLFSRTGTLIRTYSGTSDWSVASADGTRLTEWSADGRVVVRDVASGTVTRRVPLPAGMVSCIPKKQFDASSFSMDCAGTIDGAPDHSTAFRAGYTSAVKTTKVVPFAPRAGDVHRMSNGAVVFNRLAGSEGFGLSTRGADDVSHPLDVVEGISPFGAFTGAYGEVVYLHGSVEAEQPYTLQKFSIVGETVRLAGPGSPLGGLVTSAKTVDGT